VEIPAPAAQQGFFVDFSAEEVMGKK